MAILFWSCLGLVVYTYLGYPLLLAVWARLLPRPWQRGPFSGSFTIVVAAHNEEANLTRRLAELLKLLQPHGLNGQLIVVSDGSTDGTVALTRQFAAAFPLTVLDLQPNQGKAAALSAGCQAAGGDILVFADARQRWDPQALALLLENFADPQVGAVSGDLVLESASGVARGLGLYWRFEKWLRKKESLAGSQVGVTGAIAAVRRRLFHPIPQGTVLDDVYWPLRVAMQGSRVVHDERALAFDRLSDQPRAEFRRKVRTLAGNFQLLTRLPAALFPWKNPVWFAWWSHKLLRLLVPWALLGMAASSAWLWEMPLYLGCLLGQGAGYALALLGLLAPIGRRIKIAGAAAAALVLNVAAWIAFWVWITGRTEKSWSKTTYQQPPR